MGDYSEIEDLFIHRLREYQKNTDDILESIPTALEAITRTLVDEQKEYGTLKWEDAQYIVDDGIIILIGNVRLSIGESIRLDDGRVVSITEENVETLRRLVRVSLPVDLAVDGSVEEVMQYLAERQHRDFTPIQNEDGEPQSVDDLLKPEMVDEYHSQILKDQMEEILGFDTEGLTDEQIEQILLNSDGGTKH